MNRHLFHNNFSKLPYFIALVLHVCNMFYLCQTGSLVWVIPPELFKQGPRDVAASFSVVTLWITIIIFAVTFEFMAVSVTLLVSSYIITLN